MLILKEVFRLFVRLNMCRFSKGTEILSVYYESGIELNYFIFITVLLSKLRFISDFIFCLRLRSLLVRILGICFRVYVFIIRVNCFL